MELKNVVKRVKAQQGDERSNMLKATGMTPMDLNRWLDKPDTYPLDPDQLDLVIGWLHGEFGMMSSGNGWMRMKNKAGAPKIMVRAQHAIPLGKKYGNPVDGPNCPTGAKMLAAKRKGADIPERGQLRKEAEARKLKAEMKNPQVLAQSAFRK
jgi:hypothetical protein